MAPKITFNCRSPQTKHSLRIIALIANQKTIQTTESKSNTILITKIDSKAYNQKCF